MGVSNPTETVIGILMLLDQVKEKIGGTKLAELHWRPADPEASTDLADLAGEALARCEDVTEAVIVVTVAAMAVAARSGSAA